MIICLVHGGDHSVVLVANLDSFVLHRLVLVKDYKGETDFIVIFSPLVEKTSFKFWSMKKIPP